MWYYIDFNGSKIKKTYNFQSYEEGIDEDYSWYSIRYRNETVRSFILDGDLNEIFETTEFDIIDGPNCGIFLVQRKNEDRKMHEYNYVNTKGELLFPNKWLYEASPFRNCNAVLKEVYNGPITWIKDDNSVLLSLSDGDILTGHPFMSNNLAVVIDNSRRQGYINRVGERVIKCLYSKDSGEYGEGLISIRNDEGKYGFINLSGDVIIDFNYFYSSSFSNGISHVKQKDKGYYFIDKNENEVNILKHFLLIENGKIMYNENTANNG